MQYPFWCVAVLGISCPLLCQPKEGDSCRDLEIRTQRISATYNQWSKFRIPSPQTVMSALGAGTFGAGTLTGGSDYIVERPGCSAKIMFDSGGVYSGVRFILAATHAPHLKSQLERVNEQIRELRAKLENLERFRDALSAAQPDTEAITPTIVTTVASPTPEATPTPKGYQIDDGSPAALAVVPAPVASAAAYKQAVPAQRSIPKPAPAPSRSSLAAPAAGTDRTLHVGPRGGCYWIGSTGRRNYVDRSSCR